MKPTILLFATIVLGLAYCASADYGVIDKGEWPDSWPKELEPLRKQARTLEGPLQPLLHYHIPFTKQAEFEAAWPHLLKVKSAGAPIVLVAAPYTRLGRIDAGVIVHTPPAGSEKQVKRAAAGQGQRKASDHWEDTVYLELIVDGDIVNLNRLALPPDTPIIDQRFGAKETQK